MNQSNIKNRVLQILYEAFFQSNDGCNLMDLAKQEGWEKTPFRNLIDRMSKERLIKFRSMGGWYAIDSTGVLFVEESGIVPEERVSTNQRARTQILVSLAEVYDERGSLYTATNAELIDQGGFDANTVRGNLLVLLDLGYAESSGNAGSRLTHIGLTAVEDYRKNKSIADEFEVISELSPQPRGRALQKLIAKVSELHGWGQEESVRTSNEEMDVIIFRDREYFLPESKWEKDRIEAHVIRELFGKLNNRSDVHGIVVSMSGFTEGAIKQVEDYVGQRIILLFGGEDIRALCYRKTSFGDLLNAKYKELVTKRKVQFR